MAVPGDSMLSLLNRNNTKWETKDREYLEENYPNCEIKVNTMANKLKRSRRSIYTMASSMGLKRNESSWKGPKPKLRPWEIEDVDWKIYYYRHYRNCSSKEIGEILKLSTPQVQNRMYSRGLHMHPPGGDPPEWFTEKVGAAV